MFCLRSSHSAYVSVKMVTQVSFTNLKALSNYPNLSGSIPAVFLLILSLFPDKVALVP